VSPPIEPGLVVGFGSMVGARAWLVTLPLLLVVSEFGQWLLDRFAAATGEAELFDHSPLAIGMLPLLLAVVFVAAGAGLLLDVRRPATVTMPRRTFALLPLCVFVVQEHIECVLAHGRPWTVALHWSFLAGLLIQIPLVLGGYAVARLLIRVATRVLRRRRAAARPCPTALVIPRPEARALLRRARPLADARFNRGPPLVAA
jgi:hypothetical protein